MDKTAKKYKIIRYCADAAFLLLEATVFLLSGKFTSKETGEVVFWGLPAYASVPLMIGISQKTVDSVLGQADLVLNDIWLLEI